MNHFADNADERLQYLRRQHEVDPKNDTVLFQLMLARSRVEGPLVFLENRGLWNRCPHDFQDKAIHYAAEKLAPDFQWLRTQEYSCGGQTHRIASFVHNETNIELNLLPGDTFFMGTRSLATELEYCRRYDNSFQDSWINHECPVRAVFIAPLLVGRFVVNQREWCSTDHHNPSSFKGEDLPLESASCEDVHAWLRDIGHGLRLPSEAEWEYACRGGTDTRFYWGNEFRDDYCWYLGQRLVHTCSVHAHKDYYNAFGLVDMNGLVFEWCQDSYISNYRTGPHDYNPRVQSSSSEIVIRGGSWLSGIPLLRSANRSSIWPTWISADVGFRLVRSLNLQG